MSLTEAQFIEKVRVRLGSRRIDVNLSDDDIRACIEDAIYQFTYWHYDGTEWGVYPLTLTTASDYTLPSNIHNVFSYYRPNDFNTPTLSRLVLTELNIMYESSNLINFQVFKDYIKTVENVLFPNYDFRFNETTKRISFRFKPEVGDIIYLAVTENVCINDMVMVYEDNWFIRYTTELCRLKWADLVGKYSKKLTNGAVINWENMRDRAIDSIDKLESELRNERSYPTPFITG